VVVDFQCVQVIAINFLLLAISANASGYVWICIFNSFALKNSSCSFGTASV
jgi:hypothetical protein